MNKDFPKISERIKKDPYMNSQQQISKVTKNIVSSKVFREPCLRHNIFSTLPTLKKAR